MDRRQVVKIKGTLGFVLSITKIGEQLGVSRNAVAGKAID